MEAAEEKMSELLSKNNDLTKVPMWEAQFYENYGNDESILFFNFHHSLGDGIALLSLACCISDNITMDKFPYMRPMSTFQKFMRIAIAPYYVCIGLYKS